MLELHSSLDLGANPISIAWLVKVGASLAKHNVWANIHIQVYGLIDKSLIVLEGRGRIVLERLIQQIVGNVVINQMCGVCSLQHLISVVQLAIEGRGHNTCVDRWPLKMRKVYSLLFNYLWRMLFIASRS